MYFRSIGVFRPIIKNDVKYYKGPFVIRFSVGNRHCDVFHEPTPSPNKTPNLIFDKTSQRFLYPKCEKYNKRSSLHLVIEPRWPLVALLRNNTLLHGFVKQLKKYNKFWVVTYEERFFKRRIEYKIMWNHVSIGVISNISFCLSGFDYNIIICF